jgi:fatty acid desaturase
MPDVATTMLPPPELLPDVLPTERLSATGRPVPQLRESLRRIPNARNVLTVAGALAQSLGVIVVADRLAHPLAWVAAFFLMGRAHCLLSILGHEAAHRLLFTSKRANDLVGRWLLAYPSFTAFDLYRRAHMAHHKDEMGPNEPDMGFYAGYPIPMDSFRRKLKRDALFISGWKNLRPLVKGLTKPGSRPLALRILATQAGVLAVITLTTGKPWLYPLLWLAPWMSVWKVLNRLRAIAEHGGMARSDDRRLTTHVVRQTPLARFWMVPYKTGWHLAHHVDSGIPFHNLPKLHQELVAAGWVPPGLEYPSYRALWKALSSGGTVYAHDEQGRTELLAD